jgi:hypothetical protein
MKNKNRTKEQILDEMIEAMPFNLSENHKPYILEAMEIYAQQQVKKCDLADVVKPKGTLCLYESGDTTSARCIHCGREKWEHKRA